MMTGTRSSRSPIDQWSTSSFTPAIAPARHGWSYAGHRSTEIRITALDADTDPPVMSLEVHLLGKRYVEDRDTTKVVSGSQSRESHFVEHWTLALSEDDQQPWRIVAVETPAPARATGAIRHRPSRGSSPDSRIKASKPTP
jgi:hypothetical protein